MESAFNDETHALIGNIPCMEMLPVNLSLCLPEHSGAYVAHTGERHGIGQDADDGHDEGDEDGDGGTDADAASATTTTTTTTMTMTTSTMTTITMTTTAIAWPSPATNMCLAKQNNMAQSTNADDRRQKGTYTARCLRRTCNYN